MMPPHIFMIILFILFAISRSVEKDPDVGRDMIEITRNKGYPIEQHFVTTDDGYILGLFRIPYGRNESMNAINIGKPPILLMHGLLDSSFTWVTNFPQQSLAYILADNGYDVWLGNNRGNTYSKRHQYLHTNTAEFWDFSYDEMAKYDSPNTIEYILSFTNKSKLAYVGHSEGTLEMFAMPTVRPDIVHKIAIFGALAPIAYCGHVKSPIVQAMADFNLIEIYEMLGRKQIMPGIYILNRILPPVCANIA
eukprot:112906_1